MTEKKTWFKYARKITTEYLHRYNVHKQLDNLKQSISDPEQRETSMYVLEDIDEQIH